MSANNLLRIPTTVLEHGNTVYQKFIVRRNICELHDFALRKNSHDIWLSCSQQEIHRRYKDPENVRMLALIFAKAFGIAKIKGLLINFFYMVVASQSVYVGLWSPYCFTLNAVPSSREFKQLNCQLQGYRYCGTLQT